MFGLIPKLIKTALWLGFFLLIAGAVLRLFFVDVAMVGHEGMAPTLVAGDYIAIWRNAAINIGDVVICRHPGQQNKHVMGRVISKAGYVVSTDRFGQIVVGDVTFRRDLRGTRKFYDTKREKLLTMQYGITRFGHTDHEFFREQGRSVDFMPVKVNKGIFLLGDNRTSRGNDSRYYGEVDPATCVGQVFMRLWPAESRGDDIRHYPLELIE